MIQIARKKNYKSAVINVIPMIDVMFFLLLFFLVTNGFIKEIGIDVNRPNAVSAQHIDKGSILIGISASGTLHFNNQQIDLLSIRGIVKQEITETPDAAVVLIADMNSKTEMLVKVMDQCKLAGAKNISIAASKNVE